MAAATEEPCGDALLIYLGTAAAPTLGGRASAGVPSSSASASAPTSPLPTDPVLSSVPSAWLIPTWCWSCRSFWQCNIFLLVARTMASHCLSSHPILCSSLAAALSGRFSPDVATSVYSVATPSTHVGPQVPSQPCCMILPGPSQVEALSCAQHWQPGQPLPASSSPASALGDLQAAQPRRAQG